MFLNFHKPQHQSLNFDFLYLGIILCLIFGIIIGLINGYLSVYLGVSSLIVTLGMLFILRGAVYLYTGQRAIPDELMSDFFFYIGNGKFMGTVPYAAMIGLIVLIIFIYVMHNTSYGRKLYAVGGFGGASSSGFVCILPLCVVEFGDRCCIPS